MGKEFLCDNNDHLDNVRTPLTETDRGINVKYNNSIKHDIRRNELPDLL